MKITQFRTFHEQDHQTWRLLFEKQTPHREEQIVSSFSEGLRILGLQPTRIPDLDSVNQILENLTGFRGVPVEGLEEAKQFFRMLSQRLFPVGNFIRDSKDLSYTPAPDVFHDLYGHLPFLTEPAYADFCQKFGNLAYRFSDDPFALAQFERLFWFTIEFALIKTPKGTRIFGAGIASSFSECRYALSGKPQIIPFDSELIRNQEFRIDNLQEKLFLLDSPEQLFDCLDSFEESLPMGSFLQIVS